MTTFFSLHYIVPWILPPGLNLILIFIGLIIWLFWPTIGKIICLISLISLWLLSTPFIAYHMADILQNQYPMLQTEELGQPEANDAIVVLGGGNIMETEYGNKQTVSDATLHRLNYAAYLHEKTYLPIIVSGGKAHEYALSEADLMADYLKDKYNIIAAFKEDKSMNTADESKFLAILLQHHQIRRVYLVTNAWHMPRSVYIFQCLGIKITPAPMGYFTYGPGYALISFLPNMEALEVSSTLFHEFIGLFWYRLHYGSKCVEKN